MAMSYNEIQIGKMVDITQYIIVILYISIEVNVIENNILKRF